MVPLEWRHSAMAARYGSWRGWAQMLLAHGATLRQVGNAVAAGLGDALEARLMRDEVAPVDATVQVGRDGPVCVPHRAGRGYDRAAVALALAEALDGREGAPLPLAALQPAVTLDEVRHCTRKLAVFTTAYNAQSEGRSHNLALAAASLNGHIVGAGEVFSFNATVGPRTAERGYRAAPSIAQGRYIDTVGGGVCQLSTTLYNAVLLAGLQARAAHHSMAVHYVPPGRDAMVSEGCDMTFDNTTDHPVYIFAEAQAGQLTVRLYGPKVARDVRLDSTSTVLDHRDVDGAGRVLTDTTGYNCIAEGYDGMQATLVRWQDGRQEVLRRCTYAPKDAVWQRVSH